VTTEWLHEGRDHGRGSRARPPPRRGGRGAGGWASQPALASSRLGLGASPTSRARAACPSPRCRLSDRHGARPAGALIAGTLGGREVIALAGRFHMYEGHPAALAGFPVRVVHALGARTLFVSNAAGGVRRTFAPAT
jgi:hypothetical protein